MSLTAYSVITALLCSGLFVALLAIFRRWNAFVLRFGFLPLLCLLVVTILRLFLSVEFSFTTVVGSTVVMPAILIFLRKPLFLIGSLEVSAITLLLFVWFTGAAVFILHFWYEWIRFARKVKRYSPIDAYGASQVIGRLAGRAVCLTATEETIVPYVIGFFKATIVLPDMAYSDEDLELILIHEWQHFINRDQWSKMLVQMLCYLLWWNPLIVLLKRQLDQTLELQCDFRVLSKLPEERRDSYFEMLLQVYRASARGKIKKDNATACVSALLASQTDRPIIQRFKVGLNYSKIEKQKKALSLLLCAAIIAVFAASYLIVLQPEGRAPTEEDGYQLFTTFAENTYLVANEDGTYSIYFEMAFGGVVKDITVEPFNSLPIHKK